MSASRIAEKFHVSDTYALQIFDKYVKLDRLPLSDIISIDEVHVNLDEYCKYALVIQDFYTGDPIDLLCSRRQNVTEPYFVSIPREERYQIKYLITDMYNPYIRYVDKYFSNAVPVVDSFHVLQSVITAIDKYIRQIIKNLNNEIGNYTNSSGILTLCLIIFLLLEKYIYFKNIDGSFSLINPTLLIIVNPGWIYISTAL